MGSHLFEWYDSKEEVTKRRHYSSVYDVQEAWCRALHFINWEDRVTLKTIRDYPTEYPVICNFWEAHQRYEEFRNFMDGGGKYRKKITVAVWYKEDIEEPLRKEIRELKAKIRELESESVIE